MKKIITSVVTVIVVAIALGKLIPALWPSFIASGDDVAALSDNSTATPVLQAFWVIVLIVIGLGIAVMVIMWALDKFDLGSHFGYITIDTLYFGGFYLIGKIFNKSILPHIRNRGEKSHSLGGKGS